MDRVDFRGKAPLITIYNDSWRILGKSLSEQLIARSIRCTNTSRIVFFILSYTYSMERDIAVLREILGKNLEELHKKYGVLGYRRDLITTLPVIDVDSRFIEEHGLSERKVLDALDKVLDNTSIPVEVVFTDRSVKPLIEDNPIYMNINLNYIDYRYRRHIIHTGKA